MYKLKDTVVILFHGGTYGKYLHWILNNYTELGNQTDLKFRLDEVGSSHNQTINGDNTNDPGIADQKRWKHYVNGNTFYPFYVRHLIEGSEDYRSDPVPELEDVANTVDKVILLQAKPNRNLMALNNNLDKTFKNPKDFYNAFNRFKDFKVNTNKLDEVREMFSYKMFHLDYRIPIEHNLPNVLNVDMDNLLNFPVPTLLRILDFLDTKLTIPMHQIVEEHNNMLKAQVHLNKDSQIKEFLECFSLQIDCNLPKNCSIIDEAYIQKYLRDELNLEIKCDGLIEFPKTTTELRAITYPAEDMKC